MIRRVSLLVAFLACVAVLGSAQVVEDVVADPLLAVSKTVSSKDIVLGSKVDVRVTVTNIGQNTAYNVVAHDMQLDATERVEKVDSLSFGESFSFHYVVKPSALGAYPISLSRVTYNLEPGNNATAHTAYSNAIREEESFFGTNQEDEALRGSIGVYTREQYDRVHARYFREVVAYLFLGLVLSLTPFVLYRMKKSEMYAIQRRSRQK